MDFSGADIQSIEEAFQTHRAGGWRRLDAATLAQHPALLVRAGWHLDVPQGQFTGAPVDRLLLLLGHAFPKSELRVVAPALKLGDWPHVESGGVLCLRRTSWSASAGDRAIANIADACEILDFDEARCKAEFAREFSAYWVHMLSAGSAAPTFMTLMAPEARSREIFFAKYRKGGRVVLADDRASLERWLGHIGEKVERRDIRETRLIWLPEPWTPAEFPLRAQDVFSKAEWGVFNSLLRVGESLPVIFGATTETGPVMVGVEVPGGTNKQYRNGFRPGHVPGAAVAMFTASQSILRCRLERADAAWVHGRDHNAQLAMLARMTVGIVGCGSLGAAVARLLVQMGVGNFILIDSEELTTANTSRHVLGSGYVRENKAVATRRMLLRDFPHLTSIESLPKLFQKLVEPDLGSLATCDVVVSAGIDSTGDAVLDHWRRGLANPPVHVCTWVEEYALAGHAIALFADDSLLAEFTADGMPNFCLTQWPPAARTVIAEAGCGNVFQPHGAVDLNNSVGLAAKLVMDVLIGDVTRSCRRAWLGDRTRLVNLGGAPSAAFNVSNTVKVFAWPDGNV